MSNIYIWGKGKQTFKDCKDWGVRGKAGEEKEKISCERENTFFLTAFLMNSHGLMQPFKRA